jgi:signal transduction histidine kinase
MRLTAYLTRRYNTVADLPENPLIATYDAQQIEQVLINMIHNAIQAMPNGGSLQISLKQVDETAQVSIQDSGSGISAEHLKRIFDPFFTTKKEGEGTGLGLSVSYGIIANHRGKIDVESELGKGTKFTIILPVTQPTTETGETK